MRRSPLVVLAATAAGLVVPAVASADVYVDVPTGFLGGPIWSPLPATTPEAAGRPSLAPRPASDPCRDAAPGDCAVVGPDADVEAVPLPAPGPGGLGDLGDGVGVEDDPPPDADTPAAVQQEAAPAPAPLPAAPPAAGDLAAAFGGLVSPAPADWLAWQRPTLRWTPQAGASYYNVQIFRGPRRVLNAWSTDTRLRVPEGVLRQGRSYVWVVWPAAGERSAARYGTAIGRATFAITLRPRIVFRRQGGRGRSTVAEVRPHIPFATLRLRRPGALVKRVPRTVTLDRRGRFVLPISTRAAERLGALLTDRGPNPPVGLRGPGL